MYTRAENKAKVKTISLPPRPRKGKQRRWTRSKNCHISKIDTHIIIYVQLAKDSKRDKFSEMKNSRDFPDFIIIRKVVKYIHGNKCVGNLQNLLLITL